MSGDPSGWVWFGPGQPDRTVCGGGIPQHNTFATTLPTTLLGTPAPLSDADVERIAKRVAELLKAAT